MPTRDRGGGNEPGLDGRMLAWWRRTGEDGAGFGADYGSAARPSQRRPAPARWEQQTTRGHAGFLARAKLVRRTSRGLRTAATSSVATAATTTASRSSSVPVVEGRRYDVTTDLLVYPIDRIRPIEGSAFHGYEVRGDMDFPFALVRREGAAAYRFDGRQAGEGQGRARRAAVALTGKQRFLDGVLYFQTTEGCGSATARVARRRREEDAQVGQGRRALDRREHREAGAPRLRGDEARLRDARLERRGGARGSGDEQVARRGIFRIHTKHLTTTMSSKMVGEEFELKDIPYVQYFEKGYALHAAYWHDDFGTPRSHGCINLAPEDARWLFQWTEPQLPPGWHGVAKALTGTVVFVHP